MAASAKRRARGIERLLRRVAQRTGDGTTLTGNIEAEVARSGPSYNRTIIYHTYTAVCLWGGFKDSERAGGLVSDGDARLFVAARIPKDPVPVGAAQAIIDAPDYLELGVGHRLLIDGTTYQVETVDQVRPGGVNIMFSCKVIR